MPLGRFRLRSIELLLIIFKLHRQPLYDAIIKSEVLGSLNSLVHRYMWNNFLHLKVQYIWTEIITVSQNAEFRKTCMFHSNIGKELSNLGESNHYTHASERQNRAGHMGLVTQISNLLRKSEKEEVKEYVASLDKAWTDFVEGELKETNSKNEKSLGD